MTRKRRSLEPSFLEMQMSDDLQPNIREIADELADDFEADSEIDLNVLIAVAAQAPNDVPHFFRHRKSPKDLPLREQFEAAKEAFNDQDRQYLRAWLSGDLDFTDVSKMPPYLATVINEHHPYFEALQAWTLADYEARYFQWRVFYARRLIEELANSSDED